MQKSLEDWPESLNHFNQLPLGTALPCPQAYDTYGYDEYSSGMVDGPADAELTRFFVPVDYAHLDAVFGALEVTASQEDHVRVGIQPLN